jgi:hypothetical protein
MERCKFCGTGDGSHSAECVDTGGKGYGIFPDPFSSAPTMRTLTVLISSPDPDAVEQKILEIDGVLSVVAQ